MVNQRGLSAARCTVHKRNVELMREGKALDRIPVIVQCRVPEVTNRTREQLPYEKAGLALAARDVLQPGRRSHQVDAVCQRVEAHMAHVPVAFCPRDEFGVQESAAGNCM